MKLISVLPDVTDPDDPTVVASLAWTCDVCKAPKNVYCANTINPVEPLGRAVHFARLQDRRREPKEKS